MWSGNTTLLMLENTNLCMILGYFVGYIGLWCELHVKQVYNSV